MVSDTILQFRNNELPLEEELRDCKEKIGWDWKDANLSVHR